MISAEQYAIMELNAIRSEARKEGRDERDREKIAMKIRKGRSPEWIHEEDEYPMDLIMEVKREIDNEPYHS